METGSASRILIQMPGILLEGSSLGGSAVQKNLLLDLLVNRRMYWFTKMVDESIMQRVRMKFHQRTIVWYLARVEAQRLRVMGSGREKTDD